MPSRMGRIWETVKGFGKTTKKRLETFQTKDYNLHVW